MMVPDATMDELFKDSPYVDGTLASIVSYAGTQLVSSNGVAYGTLCVWNDDYRPLTDGELAFLDRLGEITSLVMEQHRSTVQMSIGVEP